MITKKLGDEIFAWSPNAWNGKGYWFVLGTNGGLGRAASKKEASALKNPNKEPAKSKLPRQNSPKKSEVGNKMKENAGQLKKKFEPSKVAKGVTGTKESKFNSSQQTPQVEQKSVKASVPQAMSGGAVNGVSSENALIDALTSLYELIKNNLDSEKKQKEIQKNFEEEKLVEADRAAKTKEKDIKDIEKAKKKPKIEKIKEKPVEKAKAEKVKPEAAKAPKPEAAKAPKPEAAKAPKPEAAKVPKPEAAKVPKAEAAKVPKAEAAKVPKAEAAKVPKAEPVKAPSVPKPSAEVVKPPAPSAVTPKTTTMAKAAAPAAKVALGAGAAAVVAALAAAGLSSKAQANVLAQVKAESNFKPQSENLNYSSAKSIQSTFGKTRIPTEEFAQQFVKNPEALANHVYAKTDGNSEPGDGWKYRGRGFLQITGKNAYKSLGDYLKIDLVSNPDLLNSPDVAAKSIPWFFLRYKSYLTKGDPKALENISLVNKAVGFSDPTGKKATDRAALASEFESQGLNTGSQLDQASKENKDLKAQQKQAQAPVIVNNTTNNVKQGDNKTVATGGPINDNPPYQQVM
jgi:putative chitinase